MGFHPAKFGFLKPCCSSYVEACYQYRRTDRQHSIYYAPYRGRGRKIDNWTVLGHCMYKYSCIFRSSNNVFHLGFSGFLLMKSGILCVQNLGFLQNHSGNTIDNLDIRSPINQPYKMLPPEVELARSEPRYVNSRSRHVPNFYLFILSIFLQLHCISVITLFGDEI